MRNPRRGILRSDQAETGRIEAFSDGVFAIVITLLVLEIHPPSDPMSEAALWRAVAGLLPMLGAWIVSFAFVLVLWVSHHNLFRMIERADRGVMWLNGLCLMCICFTPFPTAMVARYPGASPATFLMALSMFLAAGTFSLLRWYATFSPHLLRPGVPRDLVRRAMRRSLLGPVLYGLAVLLAFVAPWGSLAIQVLVLLIFFLPLGGGALREGAQPR